MGYSTRYELNAEYAAVASPGAAIADLVKTSEEAGYCLKEDGSSADSGKWYEHEAELINHSKRYPHILFTLAGDGQEQGDTWKKYFLNGCVQVERATVTIAPFDPAKLKGVKP